MLCKAADLSLAWGLSTSCTLSFSLKILFDGPKRSVFLGCSYLAEENLNLSLPAF